MKKLILIFAVFLFTLNLQSQSDDSIQNQFELSYQLEKSDDFKGSINALMKIYNSENYFINLRLGWLFYLNRDYNSSKKYYDNAKIICNSCSDALIGLTLPYSKLNEWNKVEDAYLQILKKDPNNYTANLFLGQFYYNSKEYNKSISLFEKIAYNLPADYENTLYLAWNYYFLGNKQKAKEKFLLLQMLSPKDPSALEGLKLLK